MKIKLTEKEAKNAIRAVHFFNQTANTLLFDELNHISVDCMDSKTVNEFEQKTRNMRAETRGAIYWLEKGAPFINAEERDLNLIVKALYYYRDSYTSFSEFIMDKERAEQRALEIQETIDAINDQRFPGSDLPW